MKTSIRSGCVKPPTPATFQPRAHHGVVQHARAMFGKYRERGMERVLRALRTFHSVSGVGDKIGAITFVARGHARRPSTHARVV